MYVQNIFSFIFSGGVELVCDWLNEEGTEVKLQALHALMELSETEKGQAVLKVC
jgi:hypothetical protein